MSEPLDDGIENLLRATGRRPAPPLERTARVRDAVLRHWRGERRRRMRRRALWIGAAAAAAGIAIAVLVVPWRTATSVGGIVARVERADPGARLAAGEVIEAGAALSTGDEGRLALRLGSGDAVRLDRGTRLRVLSERLIVLQAGAIYVDSVAASALEIRTPFGSIHDQGTQFFVRLDASALHLGVREGRVALGDDPARTVVEAGQLLSIEGGRRTLTREPGSGESWAFAGEIAPMAVIEGRTARAFLDWAARELGLVLRFESQELEASAGTIVLQGSVEGMTLEQALQSVLPTCGMRHRVEDGTLRIGPVQGEGRGRE